MQISKSSTILIAFIIELHLNLNVKTAVNHLDIILEHDSRYVLLLCQYILSIHNQYARYAHSSDVRKFCDFANHASMQNANMSSK